MIAARPKPGRHAGFSLIEVLIALVILSVGLLGIAAMVSVSLKSRDSSYQRTQAMALANAMLDRMRANRSTVTTGGYDLAAGPDSDTAPDCYTTTCTKDQIAVLDQVEWKNDLARLLPDGDGSITTVAVAQLTQVTITITWNDQRANQAVGGDSTNDTATFTIVSGM